MLKALVVYYSRTGATEAIAKAIAEGVSVTGVQADLVKLPSKPVLSDYPLVFFGAGAYSLKLSRKVRSFINENNWAGKTVALFAAHGALGKKFVEETGFLLEAKGAKVVNTISLKASGHFSAFGIGSFTESDFVRARAFGEKTCNTFFGIRFYSENEKHKIVGYVK